MLGLGFIRREAYWWGGAHSKVYGVGNIENNRKGSCINSLLSLFETLDFDP